mmetsp:Transcript_3012/g.5391  ORF Transcript_3012/g.5391 Transcript_3012/m.5391 type:complete len:820 (-) Transcript_3012:132-2591(-)
MAQAYGPDSAPGIMEQSQHQQHHSHTLMQPRAYTEQEAFQINAMRQQQHQQQQDVQMQEFSTSQYQQNARFQIDQEQQQQKQQQQQQQQLQQQQQQQHHQQHQQQQYQQQRQLQQQQQHQDQQQLQHQQQPQHQQFQHLQYQQLQQQEQAQLQQQQEQEQQQQQQLRQQQERQQAQQQTQQQQEEQLQEQLPEEDDVEEDQQAQQLAQQLAQQQEAQQQQKQQQAQQQQQQQQQQAQQQRKERQQERQQQPQKPNKRQKKQKQPAPTAQPVQPAAPVQPKQPPAQPKQAPHVPKMVNFWNVLSEPIIKSVSPTARDAETIPATERDLQKWRLPITSIKDWKDFEREVLALERRKFRGHEEYADLDQAFEKPDDKESFYTGYYDNINAERMATRCFTALTSFFSVCGVPKFQGINASAPTTVLAQSRPDIVWYKNLEHTDAIAAGVQKGAWIIDGDAAAGTTSRLDCAKLASKKTLPVPCKQALEEAFGHMVLMGLEFGFLSTTEFTWFLRRNNCGVLFLSKPYPGIRRGDNKKKISLNQAMCLFLVMANDMPCARDYYPSVERKGEKDFLLKVAQTWGDKMNATPVVSTLNSIEQLRKTMTSSTSNGAMASSYPNGGLGAAADQARLSLIETLPLSEANFSIPLPWKTQQYTPFKSSEQIQIARISFTKTWKVYVKTLLIGNEVTPDEVSTSEAPLRNEIMLYQNQLRSLQGRVVPFMVHGGVFHQRLIVATTDAGSQLSREHMQRDPGMRNKVIQALMEIHKQNVIHGNAVLENVLYDPKTGLVNFVGFSHAYCSSDIYAKEEEFQKLDALLMQLGYS